MISPIWMRLQGRHWEAWCKIPLGWWKGTYYHLEYLHHTSGWHWHYLLVTLDFPMWVKDKVRPSWRTLRWQRQMKAIPLSSTRIIKDWT